MCRSATFGLTGWLQDTQKICRSVSSLSPSFTCGEMKEASASARPPPRGIPGTGTKRLGAGAHLLVLLHVLLLGLGDDALQFVEASLHLGEAQPGALLLPPDAFQLLLAVLLGDAGALLPLLDALREDLVDATGKQKKKGVRTDGPAPS